MTTRPRTPTLRELNAQKKLEAAKAELRQAQKEGKAEVARLQKKEEQRMLKFARKAGVFEHDLTDEDLQKLFAQFVEKKLQAPTAAPGQSAAHN